MDAQFKDSNTSLALALRHTASNLHNETVTLRELLESIGEQGLLLFCSLITLPFLFPVSIPGVSTVFGLVIILIGISVTLNRVPWLPAYLMNRPIVREQLLPTLDRGANIVERLEYWIKPRFSAMSTGSFVNKLNGIALTASGVLLIFPLSFVPFSNTLPALAILFLAFGILQRDGYLIIAGYFTLAATVVYFAGLALVIIVGGQALLF